jgi:hypothetical protein
MKYCEITTFIKCSQKVLEKKIMKYYNTKYEYHGKAEAVEVELM